MTHGLQPDRTYSRTHQHIQLIQQALNSTNDQPCNFNRDVTLQALRLCSSRSNRRSSCSHIYAPYRSEKMNSRPLINFVIPIYAQNYLLQLRSGKKKSSVLFFKHRVCLKNHNLSAWKSHWTSDATLVPLTNQDLITKKPEGNRSYSTSTIHFQKCLAAPVLHSAQ